MNPYIINITILVIAAVVPVYLIIRLGKFGYPVGILVVLALFILRDYLLIEKLMEDVHYFFCIIFHFLVGISYCTPVFGLKELFIFLRNRKKGIRASRRKKVVLVTVGLAVLLEMPMWWLWIGLVQCYAYRMISSDQSLTDRLSIKPTRIKLPQKTEALDFSLGYAQVTIEPKLISSIKLISRSSVFIDCSEWNVAFITPNSPTYEKYSKGLVNWKNPVYNTYVWGVVVERKPPSIEEVRADPIGRLKVEMIEDPYNWNVRTMNTMPKTYREVFYMKRDEFREYISLAMAKAFGPRCEGDIGIFEAEYIRGIILFGWGGKAGEMCAKVYSRESNINQAILVQSDSREKSEKVLLSILASYKFIISEAPGKDELRQMIIAEIGKHDKFIKTEQTNRKE